MEILKSKNVFLNLFTISGIRSPDADQCNQNDDDKGKKDDHDFQRFHILTLLPIFFTNRTFKKNTNRSCVVCVKNRKLMSN